MSAVCHNCGGTGSTTRADLLDCAQCDVAPQRAALEAAIKRLESEMGEAMTRAERDWFAHTWKPLADEPA